MKPDIKNRSDIEKVVNNFYETIKTDSEIGYLFTEVALVNWEKHLPIMYDFWENILFHTGNFDGNPMMKHRLLHQKSELTEAHFNHWIALWQRTVDASFEGKIATEIKIRAINIAKAMMYKVLNENREL